MLLVCSVLNQSYVVLAYIKDKKKWKWRKNIFYSVYNVCCRYHNKIAMAACVYRMELWGKVNFTRRIFHAKLCYNDFMKLQICPSFLPWLRMLGYESSLRFWDVSSNVYEPVYTYHVLEYICMYMIRESPVLPSRFTEPAYIHIRTSSLTSASPRLNLVLPYYFTVEKLLNMDEVG